MIKLLNPPKVHRPSAVFSHGAIAAANAPCLHISGQLGMDGEGRVPASFEEEAELAWWNVAEILSAAGLSIRHLVKTTIYLTRREDLDVFRGVRGRHLGDHAPAMTVVFVSGLASEQCHVEIEGVAAVAEA